MIPRTDERPNTIALQWQDSKYEEYRAAPDTTIYPGMALEITIDEQNPSVLPPGVKPYSGAGADSVLRIATECLLGSPVKTSKVGMGIADPYTGDTDAKAVARGTGSVAAFSYGDLITAIIPRPGDVFQARVATTANFAIGALMKLHTDGTFIAHGGSGKAVVQVMEDHDFTADDPAITPLLRVQAV